MFPEPESNFVETVTSRCIVGLLALTQKSRLLVSIEGPPGIGKTTAVQHYAANGRAVWRYVTRRDTGAKSALFRELAISFAGTRYNHAHDNFNAIMDAARRSDFESKVLLVIDEAQNLNADSLEMLRSLYDEGGIGLALVGNHTFTDRHNAERKAVVSSPQFQSRLSATLDLERVTIGDAAAVARAHGITDSALVKRLGLIARGPKGLRIIETVARLGAENSETGKPDSADYRAALDILQP